MHKRIYLDFASATPLDPRVRDRMEPYFSLAYGNPSALHEEGRLARRAVDESRDGVARSLGVHPDEIVFTGSGTESAHLAIAGVIYAYKTECMDHSEKGKPHVITSEIEHQAVLGALRAHEANGDISVTYLPVTTKGVIDPLAVKDALTSETILVSLMMLNNEIGTVQPIEEVARIMRSWKKKNGGAGRDLRAGMSPSYPYFHTDACQGANTLDLNVNALGVDLLTLNAAKIYGPKGIGALCVRRGVHLASLVHGGGQEGGRRSGTENVPGIVGLAHALDLATQARTLEIKRMRDLRTFFISEIGRLLPSAVINCGEGDIPSGIMSVTIPDCDHEYLAVALDVQGISVATKSACDEHDAEMSHVLLSLRSAARDAGSSEKDLPPQALRFSFGRDTSEADITRSLSQLARIVLQQSTV